MSIVYGTYDLGRPTPHARTCVDTNVPFLRPFFSPDFSAAHRQHELLRPFFAPHAQDFGATHRRLNELALADELEQRAEMWGMDP